MPRIATLTMEQRKANKKACNARWRERNRAKTRADAKLHHENNRDELNRKRRERYYRQKAERLAVAAESEAVVEPQVKESQPVEISV